MASFVVNRGIQFSVEVRCRILLASCQLFGANREYTSSRPVRCLQKDKTQNFTLLDSYGTEGSSLFWSGVSGVGRGARPLKSRVRRFSIQGSGDGSEYEMFSFGTEPECSDAVFNDNGEFSEFEDSTGSELYPMEWEFVEEAEQSSDKPEDISENALSKTDKLKFNKLKEDAEKMAIELLATRSFTTVELGKRLRGKKYPSDVIKLVIIELNNRGLLNDGLFAESFSQSRWISSSWGPRRIRRALLQKGVSEADITKAMDLVFMDSNMTSGPQSTYVGMSKVSMDRLFAQASKQWLRSQNASLANRRSRMVRWLQYRGFDWGVTNFILKKLESEYPP